MHKDNHSSFSLYLNNPERPTPKRVDMKYNNMPSVIPKVGSGEDKMYADLAPTIVGWRGCSDRSLAQKVKYLGKGLKEEKEMRANIKLER